MNLKKMPVIAIILCLMTAVLGTFMTSSSVRAQANHTNVPAATLNYQIVSQANGGLCLDVQTSLSAGTQATLESCGQSNSDGWTLDNIVIGYQGVHLRIRNLYSGLCLGLYKGTTQEGAPVEQFACNNNSDQSWWYYMGPSIPGNHWFTNSLINDNSSQCLGISGTVASLAGAIQWACNGNTDQTWTVSTFAG